MTSKNRIVYMDTARVVSMLWIVAVWHLSASTIYAFDLTSPFYKSVTVIALSVFAFLSGFFVSGKVREKDDIWKFYKRRLLRFYPLYLLACISMLSAWFITRSDNLMNPRQFMLSLFGLSTIIGPSPVTLWFFSMIMLFYVMTPFVELVKGNIAKATVTLSFFIICMVGVRYFNGDNRTITYFPPYFLGVLLNRNLKLKLQIEEINKGKSHNVCVVCGLLVLAISVIFHYRNASSSYLYLYRIPIAITSINFVFLLAKIVSRKIIKKSVELLGYSSMCVYLFHGQCFMIAELIFGKMNWFQAYVIVLPLTIFFAWLLQRLYDIILSHIKVV